MSKDNKKIKKLNWKRLNGTSNFYPSYLDGNQDKVTPTSATYKTEFQKVIPRYDLSMTETRDKGTGPTFLETAYQTQDNSLPKKKIPQKGAKENSKKKLKKPGNNKKKIRTDIWE